MNPATTPIAAGRHHLCFRPLAGAARTFAFGCDAAGRVDLNALDRRELFDYLYARALVGRHFVLPCVVALPGSTQ